MKITICGSMHFAKDMLEAKEMLEVLGHTISIPCDTHDIVNGSHDIDNHKDDYKHCIENDILRRCYSTIEQNDAILVLNHPKNGINGYIGANSLIEIGLAYYFGKKIFLLNPLPSVDEAKHSHEILIMQPIILNGDLSRIE